MWEHFWDGFGGATLGGIIAGAASFLAIRSQLNAERELRLQEKEAKRREMLSSIFHEVEAFWAYYMKDIGELLEKEPANSPFHFGITIPDNIFVIYDAEAAFIGTLPEFQLRNVIISTYLGLKSLNAHCLLHSSYVDKTNKANVANMLQPTTATASVLQGRQTIESKSSLVLRKIHDNAKHEVTNLLKIMRPYADPSQDDE